MTEMFNYRELTSADEGSVARLLRDIESRYPGGVSWLQSRYEDILLRNALGIGAFLNDDLIGTAILSPKGHKKMKLSTIKVAEPWRHMGVGKGLIDVVLRHWNTAGIEEAWVTVDAVDSATTNFLVRVAGFELRDCVDRRYREEARENVLVWTPDARPQSPAAVH